MKRHVFIFLGTFVAGAVIAFGARTALHDPHAGHAATDASASPGVATATPAPAPMADHGSAHAGHGAAAPAAPAVDAAKPAADDAKPVNTVCAICGMKVNPKIATETYQGKKVGFGCGACPALFRADPDKYGPAALRNEVVED
ncbi:MAG: hypothetical protein IAE82_12315 [Opitutaceae bacterium]|nr:hypothetical protein [Opitutaceae bacterium]